MLNDYFRSVEKNYLPSNINKLKSQVELDCSTEKINDSNILIKNKKRNRDDDRIHEQEIHDVNFSNKLLKNRK